MDRRFLAGAFRLKATTCSVIFALTACNANGEHVSSIPATVTQANGISQARAGDGLQACERRDNDTFAKLEECIERNSLWQHLSQFQKIADAHPGPRGHGNRDTGTPGYKASVDYVAGLMRGAGYTVTVQRYVYGNRKPEGTPTFLVPGADYAYDRDWFIARESGDGNISAFAEPPSGTNDGCTAGDFTGFTRGNVALLASSEGCDVDTQVAVATGAGAAAVILYNDESQPGGAGYEARLIDPVKVPVVGVVANALGSGLVRAARSGAPKRVHIDFHNKHRSDHDYNVIADSAYGDTKKTVVIEGHLDAIYGAGMLDNASGSTTILEIALAMAKTPTRNHLRFIWFGGEEIGLLGSKHYVKELTTTEKRNIAFDVDADVTATPNYVIQIAAVRNAFFHKKMPPNVVPQSRYGNQLFMDFFKKAGVIARNGNSNGTDSLSFAWAGIPNTGILTQQDCCKHAWETALWGGFLGNYEGKIPSHNGGCVDYPGRWCDNLDNNDPFILELTSRAVAYVAFELANRPHFPSR